MPDERRPDMPDLSVRDLQTEMNGRFRDLKTEMEGRFRDLKTDVDARFDAVDARFEAVDRRFDRVEARITEEAIETRRHFDVGAERLRTDMKLMVEGCYSRLDNHERRIQATKIKLDLEKLARRVKKFARRHPGDCLELTIKILLAPIPDEQGDRFDFLALANQIPGSVHPNVRQIAVHGQARLPVEQCRQVLLLTSRRICDGVQGQRFSVVITYEGLHSFDVRSGTRAALCGGHPLGKLPCGRPD
jgi:hypothetical protein